MKQNGILKGIGIFAMAAGISLFVACNKEDNNTTDTTKEDTGYASDQSLTEKIFDDAQTMADKGSNNNGAGAFKTTACGSVTHSGSSFVVDFGPTNCLCADGRYRRGKILVSYTGAYADSGSVHTIGFDNYYQNDNKVTGTKTVTNMGRNGLGQPYFNVTVSGSVTRADGTVITGNWNRVRTWTQGFSTPINWLDDVYEITGSGSITRPAGTVGISIASPLVVALNCGYIEAGTIVYSLPSGLTRTLNYGTTPVCDNMATLTLPSGAIISVTLP